MSQYDKLKDGVGTVVQPYADDEIPLPAYVGLMSAYAVVFGSLYVLTTRRRAEVAVPRSTEAALLTVAAYKFSRIVTMSFIGSPLRAPFTTRGESLKGGEVQDQSRGRGLQRALGNLITCPFCFNVWSTTLFAFGFSLAPRLFAHISRILTMAAAGDVLHLGYRTLREKSE